VNYYDGKKLHIGYPEDIAARIAAYTPDCRYLSPERAEYRGLKYRHRKFKVVGSEKLSGSDHWTAQTDGDHYALKFTWLRNKIEAEEYAALETKEHALLSSGEQSRQPSSADTGLDLEGL
jgi:hypothetical protein